MKPKPTLVQGAYGVRGRYRTIETIDDALVPCGDTWIWRKHREVRAMGYDRCRILMWIGYREEYLTV